MTRLEIVPAIRKQLKVKVGLMGTAGTGKTWNALALAQALGGTIVVIDSERGRALAYGGDFRFDHMRLPDTSPETYIAALALANEKEYDIVIVDSISHEWAGKEGILASVDRFGGWKEATPRHDQFIDTLFSLPRHVIATMRAKTQYQVTEVPRGDGRSMKQEITKLGIGPIQRESVEYEFDLLAMLELDHSARLHKSIIAALPSGTVIDPGDDPRYLGRLLAQQVKTWMDSGEPVPDPVNASAEKIEALRESLVAEGYEADRIDRVFAKRRLELGALTDEYVDRALAESQERRHQADPPPQPLGEQVTQVIEQAKPDAPETPKAPEPEGGEGEPAEQQSEEAPDAATASASA